MRERTDLVEFVAVVKCCEEDEGHEDQEEQQKKADGSSNGSVEHFEKITDQVREMRQESQRTNENGSGHVRL